MDALLLGVASALIGAACLPPDRDRRVWRRFREIGWRPSSPSTQGVGGALGLWFRSRLAAGGELVSNTMSPSSRAKLSSKLGAAGRPLSLSPGEYTFLRYLSCALLLALTGAILRAPALVAAAGALGYLYPEAWLRSRYLARARRLSKELPFALDLLSVCVEAGLSFDAALGRVLGKLNPGPLTEEFAILRRQMRMGRSRREALKEMAKRARSPELLSFVLALIQADQLGASISGILRTLSEQARTRRSYQAETDALKAPVKMLFPLLVFIFPALAIVFFGPVFLGGIF
ncbi:MAG: type II secretion system F family protein [Firmicutes bacterium]|nr:type II secretion system F family protein [Bacillota bacterium]